MAGTGGRRPGAGRKGGARSKLDAEARAKAAESGITPLEFFLSIFRDETQPMSLRMDAAKSAAPYMHARLSTVENVGPGGGPIKYEVSWLDCVTENNGVTKKRGRPKSGHALTAAEKQAAYRQRKRNRG
jgi:hypothetical protein